MPSVVSSGAYHARRCFASSSSSTTSSYRGTATLILTATAVGLGVFYMSDTRAAAWKHIAMPLIHATMEPEDAHRMSILSAKWGLAPREPSHVDDADKDILKHEVWGKEIQNPLGLAAGYDKHAEAIDALLGFGFGLVEIGSVTPKPQPGNPRPRMFRLPEDTAVINRYGFNSEGHEAAASRLAHRVRKYLHSLPRLPSTPLVDPNEVEAYGPALALPKGTYKSLVPGKLLGVNLGKNKTSPAESNDDYIQGVIELGPFADYVVVNVSSPNTPGLRALQRREPMIKLLSDVKKTRDQYLPHHPPLLVKIAPDVSDIELEDIATVVQEAKIDGIIISNTTISRPESLKSDRKVVREFGGLSGPPVHPLALDKVRKFYKLTQGKVPIIGCGGVSKPEDVIAFAKAGASLVQVYTVFGYAGPGFPGELKRGVANILRREGTTWRDIIGKDARK